MDKIFDKNDVEVVAGSIIDLHQTVNGQNKFVVMSLSPMDIRYEYDIHRFYEYDMMDLFKPCKYSGSVDFEVIVTEIPGDTFIKFMEDDAWWNPLSLESIAGSVDGCPFSDICFEDLTASNSVVITGGIVCDNTFTKINPVAFPVGEFFSRWLKNEHDKQFIPPATLAMSHTFSVTIPHENSELFLQMVKNVGGTVNA